MPVSLNVENAVLQFKVENGTDNKGKPLSIGYSFSGLNPKATPEVMFKTGNSLATLPGKAAQAVYTIQKSLLVNA